jgi:hypothetical protein
MPLSEPNTIQAEFFHIRNKTSLDAVMSECADRASTGSRIKTVVRFLDMDGSVTDFVSELVASTKKNEEIFQAYAASKEGVARGVLSIKLSRITHKITVLRARRASVAKKGLVAAVLKRQDIMIECEDYSFRSVVPAELHELLEAIKSSEDVWLFVYAFKPDGLVADTQTVLTHAL